MITRRDRNRLIATALLALGVPVGAAAYVGSRTSALADRLGAVAGVPARIGGIDADLTGTVRLSDVALGPTLVGGAPGDRGGDLLAADTIEASVGLESLLAGELGADELRVTGPRVQLAIERDGDSDLARAVRRLAGGRVSVAGRPGQPSGSSGLGGSRVRRIVVTSGALVARIAGLGEVSAEDVQLVPDAGGVRVITGRVRVAASAGRVSGDIVLERSAAELALPRARFGRVLAVAGAGAVAIDGTRAYSLHDVAIGRLAANGPLEVRAELDDDGARRTFSLSLAPSDLALTVRGDHIPLGPLAPLAPRSLVLAGAHATGELVVRENAGSLEVRASAAIDALRVDHPLIAPEPIPVAAHAAGKLTLGAESIAISDGALDIGAVHLHATGWLRRGTPASSQVELRLDPVACSDLLAALPLELRGPLDGMALAGTFGGRARATIDLAAPAGEGVELDTVLANDCEVSAEPPAADVTKLAGTSVHAFPDGTSAKIGKTEPGYAPLKGLPDHVSGAWIAAEDARFYDHRGLDPREIARSLDIDLRDRRVARGGSTISQQLVKNEFLTHRRTLDRKLQEVILTWRLEAKLDKHQILERYLNIIELGPRVFGLGPAAQYWFGVTPHELSTRQSAFLAALTAEPASMSRRVREAGGLDPDSAARVDTILRAMRRDGIIGPEELASAHDAAMHFTPAAIAKDE